MIALLKSWLGSRARLLVLASLVVVAYAGAMNRAPGLLWFIAALLLATLIVGLAWPRWLVSRLSVSRRGPERAEEGEMVSFQVVVRNRGFLPRFMVELIDHLPFVGASLGAPNAGVSTLGMISYVPGGGTRQFEMPLLCEKRGFYQLGPVGLASSFPLGLAEARQMRNEGVQALTVYPAVFPITEMCLRGSPSQIHRGGYLLPEGSGAAEFSGLREYRQGDNPRHVHWPTTARMNELMVKQFEPLASACLYLVLDLASDANVGAGRHATLEYAARIAGSIARFACSHNIRVRMSGAGKRPVDVDSGSGAGQYQRLLDELAVVDSDGATPYARVLEEVAMRVSNGETVVLFLSQKAAESTDIFQALTLLRGNRAHLYAVVFDRGSFLDAPTAADAQADTVTAVLQELDAYCLRVRRGDDLVQLFNA